MSANALETSSNTPKQRPIAFWIGLLLLLGLIAFGNGIRGKFIFDDIPNIVDNRAIRTITPEMFIPRPRALGNLSFAANYAINGLDERGYHVVNIAIHLAAACALLGIVRRTLRLPKLAEKFAADADWLAFSVAAIWMVHPLQTQSVTYIVQRLEALMGLFFLLTLYCVIRAATSDHRAKFWYVAALFSFLLSVSSKEVAAAIPIVVLLYDRMFLATNWRDVFRRRWGFYLACVPIMGWLFWCIGGAFMPADQNKPLTISQIVAEDGPDAGFNTGVISSWQYLRSQPAVILHYLRLSFWPNPLCLDYLWRVESNPWRIYGLGIVIVALLAASFALYFRQNSLGFLGLAFFFILAPTSSFIPIIDLAFEHRMYLPLACVVASVVLCAAWLLKRQAHGTWRKAIAYFAGVVLCVLCVGTIARNQDYADPFVLWTKVLEVSRQSSSAHFEVARRLAGSPDKQVVQRAREHLEEAIQIAPFYDDAYAALGGVLARQEDYDLAEKSYQKALELQPRKVTHLQRYARFKAERGQAQEAETLFRLAIEIDPNSSVAWVGLGTLAAQQGNFAKAVESYSEAIKQNPSDEAAKFFLAMALARQGDFSKAIPLLEAIRERQPDSLGAAVLLAWSYSVAPETELRNRGKALALSQSAVSATKSLDFAALEALAAALAENGQFGDALETAQSARKLLEGKDHMNVDWERITNSIRAYESHQPYRHALMR